jgi:hypothetical protein
VYMCLCLCMCMCVCVCLWSECVRDVVGNVLWCARFSRRFTESVLAAARERASSSTAV